MWEWGVLPTWGIHSATVQSWQRTRQDQGFPVNFLPTRWVLHCFFAGDSKGGFQSLIQNHSSKSQIPGNLHFTIWLLRPASGSDLLKHVLMCRTLGLVGGNLNFPYLDTPPNLPLIQLRLAFTAPGLCFHTPVLPQASHSLRGTCTVPGVAVFPACSWVALPGLTGSGR